LEMFQSGKLAHTLHVHVNGVFFWFVLIANGLSFDSRIL
jgi:hypothetical protein